MEIRTLHRLGAAAAVAGGTLRVADAILPGLYVPDPILQQTYFFTDVFLLLGAFAVFSVNATRVGWPGAAGFVVFFIGILLVRSPQVSFFGIGGYRSAGGIALLGIVIFGIALLAARAARVAPLLWIASFIAGLAGGLGFQPVLALLLSGLLFAIGFIAAGIEALKTGSRSHTR